MAHIRAIKKRMVAVRNIQRITKTMQMIATAKFTNAMQRAARDQAVHPEGPAARRPGRGRGGGHRQSPPPGPRAAGEPGAAPGHLLRPRALRGVQPEPPAPGHPAWARPHEQREVVLARDFGEEGHRLLQVPRDHDRRALHHRRQAPLRRGREDRPALHGRLHDRGLRRRPRHLHQLHLRHSAAGAGRPAPSAGTTLRRSDEGRSERAEARSRCTSSARRAKSSSPPSCPCR